MNLETYGKRGENRGIGRFEVIVEAKHQKPSTVGEFGPPSDPFGFFRRIATGKTVGGIEQIDQ